MRRSSVTHSRAITNDRQQVAAKCAPAGLRDFVSNPSCCMVRLICEIVAVGGHTALGARLWEKWP